jgi:hypothetical protein
VQRVGGNRYGRADPAHVLHGNGSPSMDTQVCEGAHAGNWRVSYAAQLPHRPEHGPRRDGAADVYALLLRAWRGRAGEPRVAEHKGVLAQVITYFFTELFPWADCSCWAAQTSARVASVLGVSAATIDSDANYGAASCLRVFDQVRLVVWSILTFALLPCCSSDSEFPRIYWSCDQYEVDHHVSTEELPAFRSLSVPSS